jgi:hypothetical protein
MTFSKNKKSLFWERGERISGIQFPKMWREATENGKTYKRVGKQHVMHFFGKGKRPEQCSGLDSCYLCKQSNVRTFKYRTIGIIDETAYFVDLDASLSRTLADIQVELQKQGMGIEDIQKRVYTVTKAERPKTKPAWSVMVTGEKELPEVVAVDMLDAPGEQKDNVSSLKDFRGEGALSKKKGHLASKPSKEVKKIQEEELKALAQPDEVGPIPVGLMTKEDIKYLSEQEKKVKARLEKDGNWDMKDGIKSMLKRKDWPKEKINNALEFFGPDGTFTVVDKLVVQE